MSDNDTLLQYIGSIDKSLQEIRQQHIEAMRAHKLDDDTKHAVMDESINSLKTFRTVSVVLGLLAAGGGGALKAGVVDNLVQAVLK